jgi:hypothetical protein
VPWHDAVQDCPGGVRILVEAQPGASRAVFPDGFNPWRHRLGVAVKAQAQGGKANQEVCSLLAAFFKTPDRDVSLVAGASDSRKTVQVLGIDRPTALAALQTHL